MHNQNFIMKWGCPDYRYSYLKRGKRNLWHFIQLTLCLTYSDVMSNV